MNTNTLVQRKWPRVLAFAVIALVFFIGMGLATSAHAAGTYTLKVKYAPMDNVNITSNPYEKPEAMPTDPVTTTLKLYRVGDHARNEDTGKAYFKLADEVTGIDLPKEGSDTAAWLSTARDFEIQIPDSSNFHMNGTEYSGFDPKTIVSTEDASCEFEGLEPGLYLVVGDSQRVNNYPKPGDTSFWKPQSMLVQVLQQNVEIMLKPEISYAATELTVFKDWNDTTEQEQFRPSEVTINIKYQGQVEDTIQLSDNNKWTYTWKTTVDKNNPQDWKVEEVEGPSYSYSVSESPVVNGQKTYTVTNTYNRYKLKLIKDLPIFVQHANGDKVDTVFTFELNGYKLGEDGKEQAKPVFHKIVALKFSEAGQQELEVPEIPRGLSRLEVKELKHVNYKAVAVENEGEDQDPYVKDAAGPNNDGVYTVSFKNDWDGKVHYEGSAINHYKYEKGKYAFDFTKGIVLKN